MYIRCIVIITLHSVVCRTSTTFGYNPVYVLRWIFDITRFTMYTILSIYLESFAIARFERNVFVNTCNISNDFIDNTEFRLRQETQL